MISMVRSLMALGACTFRRQLRSKKTFLCLILVGLLVSLGVPLAIYFVFTRLLKVSLPEFPFF